MIYDSLATFAAWMKGAEPLFSVAAAVIAFLVYVEAKKIRSIEWYSKSNSNWQQFNQLIISSNYHARWDDIIHGRVAWNQIDQLDKMFIYSFLNVLNFEFQAWTNDLIPKAYAEKSIVDNLQYFQAIWPEMLDHLRGDGWPVEFLDWADLVVVRA